MGTLHKGSGHADAIKIVEGRSDLLLKPYNELESRALAELAKSPRFVKSDRECVDINTL